MVFFELQELPLAAQTPSLPLPPLFPMTFLLLALLAWLPLQYPAHYLNLNLHQSTLPHQPLKHLQGLLAEWRQALRG